MVNSPPHGVPLLLKLISVQVFHALSWRHPPSLKLHATEKLDEKK